MQTLSNVQCSVRASIPGFFPSLPPPPGRARELALWADIWLGNVTIDSQSGEGDPISIRITEGNAISVKKNAVTSRRTMQNNKWTIALVRSEERRVGKECA